MHALVLQLQGFELINSMTYSSTFPTTPPLRLPSPSRLHSSQPSQLLPGQCQQSKRYTSDVLELNRGERWFYRIYALRKPKTNIQILQQNVLLRYKFLVAFTHRHGRDIFNEIRAAYVETLSRVLSSHFKAYLGAIERLQVTSLHFSPPSPPPLPSLMTLLCSAAMTNVWEACLESGNLRYAPEPPSPPPPPPQYSTQA